MNRIDRCSGGTTFSPEAVRLRLDSLKRRKELEDRERPNSLWSEKYRYVSSCPSIRSSRLISTDPSTPTR